MCASESYSDGGSRNCEGTPFRIASELHVRDIQQPTRQCVIGMTMEQPGKFAQRTLGAFGEFVHTFGFVWGIYICSGRA